MDLEKTMTTDGRVHPPLCPACGCRLKEINGHWNHYRLNDWVRTDARGCTCIELDCTFYLEDRKLRVVHA